MTAAIRDWPFITSDVRGDGSVEVVIAGTKKVAGDLDAALELIHRDAALRMQRPVRVRLTTGGVSSASLVVSPDATYYIEDDDSREVLPIRVNAADGSGEESNPVHDDPLGLANVPEAEFEAPLAPAPTSEQRDIVDSSDALSAPLFAEVDLDSTPEAPDEASQSETSEPIQPPSALDAVRAKVNEPTPEPTPEELTSTLYRRSFIHEEPKPDVAELGWRARLNLFGMHLGPGKKERALLDDIDLITTPFSGPRTIAVGNPKGSANKTPSTAMLSAVFARYGRNGVLAWDNNETRGSLAWRTQASNHDATVIEVLKASDSLLAPSAQAAELSRYTHHQPEDQYDVLRSDQSVDGDHEVSGDDVARIHQIAAHYYRLIVMDSGNNERAANWRAMIERADILVVPLTNSEDTAEAGARMLEALTRRDEHSRALAQKAVAIVSQRTPGKDSKTTRIAQDFAPLVRDVAIIPYDPHLNANTLVFDKLEAKTQRAWINAAAMVAEGL